MRLLELRANKATFQTVTFNRVGISLILGKKHSPDNNDNRRNTYNSVGKSLTIALIHFCLGSNKNPEFEDKLAGWEFILDFEVGDEIFTSIRKCSDQGVVVLNDKEYSLTDFRSYLEPKVFNLPEPIKNLTFRTLLPRFIRPDKSSYVSYKEFLGREPEYGQLLNNSFLLGLDPKLVERKSNLKSQIDDIDERKKGIESDPIMKSFFEEEEGDIEIDIFDLEQKVKSLTGKLGKFQVAEDYHEIVKEADKLKREIREYENRANRVRGIIFNIEKSLEIQPDISRTKIEGFYKQAEIELPDIVLKRLDEVQKFNEKLLDNRGRRLYKEKNDFQKQLDDIETVIKSLGWKKDQKLDYLNTRGALDEFTKLNQQLKDYSVKLEKLKQYKKLMNEYRNKQEELSKEFSEENIKTNNYLDKNSSLIQKNMLLFRSFANLFYEKKKAGIEIKNNDGKNRKRFDLKARIDDDKGDGVNDIKIFCYDWTVLKGQSNHNVKFVFHDGRLLSEIDPRQVATLFEIAFDETKKSQLQYIISANENVLKNIKDYLEQEVYDKIITENTVLELTDKSDKSKLLGIQVDLDYDKE